MFKRCRQCGQRFDVINKEIYCGLCRNKPCLVCGKTRLLMQEEHAMGICVFCAINLIEGLSKSFFLQHGMDSIEWWGDRIKIIIQKNPLLLYCVPGRKDGE